MIPLPIDLGSRGPYPPFPMRPPVYNPGLLFQFNAASSSIAALGGTFTRSSTATYRDVSGVLQTATSGTARQPHYEFDPVTTSYKQTLLLEGQRTNIALQSEDFSAAAWTPSGASISVNQTAAPDGNTTADKVIEDSSVSAAHGTFQSFTVVSGTTYTWSVFLKQNTRRYVSLNIATGATSGTRFAQIVDLQTGTLGITQTQVTDGAPTGTASTIEAWGNGWYRVSVTMTMAGSTTAFGLIRLSNAANPTFAASADPIYTGDGVSSIYVWGGQNEAGANPSSYIATAAGSVSRAQDKLSFPINFNPQSLSAYCRIIDKGESNQLFAQLFQIGNISNAPPSVGIYKNSVGTGWNAFLGNASTTATATANGSSDNQTFEAIAIVDSAYAITLNLAINKGSTVSAGPVALGSLPANWSSNNLMVGSRDVNNQGFATFQNVIVVKGVRDMAYFRSRISP